MDKKHQKFCNAILILNPLYLADPGEARDYSTNTFVGVTN
jgi:hypothetical protein